MTDLKFYGIDAIHLKERDELLPGRCVSLCDLVGEPVLNSRAKQRDSSNLTQVAPQVISQIDPEVTI